MSYELRAIIEYDAARLEVIKIKKPLAEFLSICDYGDYSTSSNCIKVSLAYKKWEKYSDNEYSTMYGDAEPEFREPCEHCQKALQIFKDVQPANKRFGIAKTRLSRIARDYRNSTVLHVDDI